MDYTYQRTIKKNDLLSLAQKMSNSNLMKGNLVKNLSGGELKKPTDNSKKTTLIYSNMMQNKERSRSVNAMMNTLLKQSEVVVKSSKEKESNNFKKFIDLNTSFESDESSSDNPTSKGNNSNNSNATHVKKALSAVNSSKDGKNEEQKDSISICNSSIISIETRFSNPYQQKMFNNLFNSSNKETQSKKVNSGKGYSNSFVNNESENFYKKTLDGEAKKEKEKEKEKEFEKVNQNQNQTPNEENILTIIQLEDLIVLEEKLNHIIDSFRFGKPGPKLCVEWWTFYIYSSFCGKFESLFTSSPQNKQIAHTNSILELLCIILIYEALKDAKITQNTLNTLKNLSNEIHQNFLVVIDCILAHITTQSMTNIWENKIQNIILSKRTQRINRKEHINIIKKNNDYLSTIFKNVIRAYSTSIKVDTNSLNFYFKQINKVTVSSINDYFRKRINQDYYKSGDSLTFIISETPVMPNIPVPYLPQNIPYSKRKHFTLVIDLDETLINFKNNENGKGLLRLRPGIKEFVEGLKPLYELIIFTAGTQDYADRILDMIEKDEKYFDKRLYRQHAIIMDNVFVKDLSKLGRDLAKVIIIDNMPHNFRLQKDNGIFIKNFYGDKYDTALIDLIPILKSIAGNPKNDVRIELKKWEKEIFEKITTNLKDEEK